ncbi:MAG: hypothetical protein R3C03_21400 [Pirellulaceae bacterium]
MREMSTHDFRRWGLLAVSLLLVGGSLFGLQYEAATNAASVVLRAGIVLFVVWLAFPQLAGQAGRASFLVAAILIALLLVAAARPKMLAVALGIAVVIFVLQTVGKRFTRMISKE